MLCVIQFNVVNYTIPPCMQIHQSLTTDTAPTQHIDQL